jgi:hypothetical protein
MRSQDELQRAHDVLLAIVLEEVPNVLLTEDDLPLHAAADTLCWVLQHDHNTNFADNLASLQALLAKAGYVLKDHAAAH